MSNGATARTQKALFRTVSSLIATITLTVAGSEMVSRFPAPIPIAEASVHQATVSGWFHVIWGDGPPGSRVAPEPLYVLIDDRGQWFRIILDGTELPRPGDALAERAGPDRFARPHCEV